MESDTATDHHRSPPVSTGSLPDRHPLRGTTRGRVLALLRDEPRTVSELADALDVTPTAVRKHLDGLRAEGLLEEEGTRKGMGRPATLYGLTDEGEALFRQGHAAILGAVLAAVRDEIGPERRTRVLRSAGARLARRLLRTHDGDAPEGFEDSMRVAVSLLHELGGRERVRHRDRRAEVLGFSCPMADYVDEIPTSCELLAGFLEELLGVPVTERCPRDGRPLCLLEARLPG